MTTPDGWDLDRLDAENDAGWRAALVGPDDDFDARWRAAANADPGHATYPEAVPGYRAQRTAQRRTRPAEGPGKAEPYIGDPWTAEPGDDAIASGHHGLMTVAWRKPDGPRVDAPVVAVDLSALTKPDRRWWDPRTWCRR